MTCAVCTSAYSVASWLDSTCSTWGDTTCGGVARRRGGVWARLCLCLVTAALKLVGWSVQRVEGTGRRGHCSHQGHFMRVSANAHPTCHRPPPPCLDAWPGRCVRHTHTHGSQSHSPPTQPDAHAHTHAHTPRTPRASWGSRLQSWPARLTCSTPRRTRCPAVVHVRGVCVCVCA